MCLGWSMNFSMKIVSSPKAFFASFFASLKDFSKDSSSRTTLIPRPPPPAAAFTITGNPIFLASERAISAFISSAFESSIMGTLAFRATTFAATLSPKASIDSGEGPINLMPSSRQRRANVTFSERKP